MTIYEFISLLEAHQCNPRKQANGKWLAHCPAHEDRHPSLSISEGEDGRILIHCFAGCSAEEIVSALGLTLRDLFPKQEVNAMEVLMSPRLESVKGDTVEGVRLEQLALGLPELVAALQRLGVREEERQGRIVVAFPVCYADGSTGFHYRIALEGRNKWMHQAGGKASEAIFGLDALSESADSVIVVESPVDAAVLIALGFPALAVLGKSNAKALQYHRQKLKGVREIFVWVEPDAPNFASEVAQALKRSVFAVAPTPELEKDAWRILKQFNGDLDATREVVADLLRVAQPVFYTTPFSVLTVQDILATQERIEWLIEGFLPQKALVGFYGDAGLGKSTFWLYTATCVTLAKPLAGTFPVVRSGVVVYCNAENPLPVLRDRLTGMLTAEEQALVQNRLLILQGVSLNPSDNAALDEFIAALEGLLGDQTPVLIILDPLNDLMPVDDFNSEADARAQMRALRKLRDYFGCTVVAIAHPPKSETASSKRWRGSQARFDAVDIAIDARRGGAEDELKLIVAKDRFGFLPSELVFARDVEFSWRLLEGEELLSEEDRKVLEIIKAAYPETLRRKVIAELAGVVENSVGHNLHRLINKGHIERVARGEYRYVPPSSVRSSEPSSDESDGRTKHHSVHFVNPSKSSVTNVMNGRNAVPSVPSVSSNSSEAYADELIKPKPYPTRPCPSCERLTQGEFIEELLVFCCPCGTIWAEPSPEWLQAKCLRGHGAMAGIVEGNFST